MGLAPDLRPVVAGMHSMAEAIDRLAAVGERALDYLESRDEQAGT